MKYKKVKKIPKRLTAKSTYWLPSKQDECYKSAYTGSWFDTIITHEREKVTAKTKVSPKTRKFTKCTRFEIYPTHYQKDKLQKWFEVYRLAYNITILYFNTCKFKWEVNRNAKRVGDNLPYSEENTKTELNFYKLRKLILKIMKKKVKFQKVCENADIYAHSVHLAIKQAHIAITAAITNVKRKNIRYFGKFRYLKKTNRGMVKIPAGALATKGYFKKLGPLKGHAPIKITREVTINYKNNRYFMIVPKHARVKCIFKKRSKCGIDPGARTFLTLYTPDGQCSEILPDAKKSKIGKLLRRINIKRNKIANSKFKKAQAKWRTKLKNLVTELHWKSARMICQTYNVIALGKLSTQRCVSKNGNLDRDSKYMLHALSHFTFSERLTYMAKKFGVKCNVVDESHTSRTCGKCGNDYDIDKSKTFRCPRTKCNHVLDRDINASRNILIKNKI